MQGPLRSHLSYANVVATLALFVALGGTSFAALMITGRNVKNGSLTSADVKDRSLLRKDFKGGQLPAGRAGPQGAKGDKGDAGDAGAPGTAAAYAAINPNGTLDASRSKNVISSAHPPTNPTGVYCLELPFTPKNAVASVDLSGGGNGASAQTRVPPGMNLSSCGANSEVQVSVLNFNGSAFVDGAVFVNIN